MYQDRCPGCRTFSSLSSFFLFHAWFDEITAFADSINILVTILRIASIQVHRANVPADSPEVCLHRNIMLLF